MKSGYSDFEKGFNWIQAAAEQGDIDAQYFLAVEFAIGENITRDPENAVFWYQKAAYLGHPEAQYNLGVMYLEGDGTEKSIKIGQNWILKSAKNGEYLAIDFLAKAYNQGLFGFPKDQSKAQVWQKKLTDI